MTVPSVDLVALSSTMARPLVVAIAHVPILIVSLCAAPLWLICFLRPEAHSDAAFRLLRELRSWSCGIVQETNGIRAR
jgi:hypothetical protein